MQSDELTLFTVTELKKIAFKRSSSSASMLSLAYAGACAGGGEGGEVVCIV